MLIDWFTVGAQVINFLVLLWLLQKFLYKPILSAMDQREKNIADSLAQAAAAKAEAENERELFAAKNRDFDRQKNEMVKAAERQADQEHQALLAAARSRVDEKRAAWEQALLADRAAFWRQLSEQAQDEVLSIARQVLADLADADLEERVAAHFLRRLDQSSPAEKAALGSLGGEAGGAVVVRSAFALSSGVRQAIADALRRLTASDVMPAFEQSPALLCGIEVVAGEQKIAWTAAANLAALHQAVEAAMERKKADYGGVG